VNARLLILLAVIVALLPAGSANASFSGAAGRIAFTSDRAGAGTSEIYSAAPDGTDVKRLTWTDAFEQEPSWSPDGSRLAYETWVEGHNRVFVMNQDGTDQHAVLPLEGGSDDMQPSWSPDGTQIAFASTRGGGWKIWAMNANGSNLRQLSASFLTHPVWSPDGSRLAATTGNGPIVVFDTNGTHERQLTTPESGRYDEFPEWSPDGTKLVFAERTFDGTVSALYTVNADGTGKQALTGGDVADYSPSWSPDGTRIVFRRRPSTGGHFQLFTVAAAGGDAVPFLGSGANDMSPSWGSSTVSPASSPPQAPQVHILSPSNGGLYWFGLQVPAFYTCSSYVSVVVSCTGPLPSGAMLDLSFSGTRSFSVTAVDAEGRQATSTVTYTVFDFTPPTIALRTPADGASYELGSHVEVSYDCTDGVGGSGIRYCGGPLPSGAPLDTSRAGSFTFQVTAVDGTGNFSTATAHYDVADRTTPTITLRAPADGATYGLGDDVTVAFTCGDGGSLQSCTGTSPNGAKLDTGRLGTFTFQVTAVDVAGNASTATASYRIADLTPPSITIGTPADGSTYILDQPVAAGYSCNDQPGGTGVASCVGGVPAGAAVDTARVGGRTFTVTATDGAGNTARATSSYAVIYDFSGFFSPVAAFPTANPTKPGEAIPLKFSLHGNRGSDLFAFGSPTWTACDASAGTNPATGTLSYNASLDRYTFLVATDKSWAGTCRDLILTLRDGTAHRARFTFGK
jgi:Tol biopolymer transport system component